MNNKIAFRDYAKDVRKTFNLENLSEVLVQKIRECELYKVATNVMLYYPTKYEINLLELLNDNKKFYLPRVAGDALQVCPYNKYDKLIKSKLKIYEPCSEPVDADVLDLVIVPALMADENGYRLGYGGGFYDRFLARCKAKTICALAEKLCVKQLPCDEFDVPIDVIISC